jgi:ABC-type antimicrobial peptide transport system permease subunit
LIPREQYQQLPAALKIDDFASNSNTSDYQQAKQALAARVVAFNSIDQAQQFMRNETCPQTTDDCKKPFVAEPYGSNYLILNEIGVLFRKIVNYLLPTILLIATIIIWFTMSRVIIESRKEIAIYRAMGARRRDIITIYVIYNLIIAFRISLTAFIIGITLAYIIASLYEPQLTAIANTAFGYMPEKTVFLLFDTSSPLLWIVAFAIFTTSMIASIQPLAHSVMRAPIEDMRNE